jgi:hypothetical protein
MHTNTIKWLLGAALLTLLLAGTHRIVEMDHAAMSGAANAPAGFYGH